jgi:Ca2+-binding EF-hand superfamily protein
LFNILEIGIDEFIQIAMRETSHNKSDIVDAFKEFDRNNDGFVSFNELADVLTLDGDDRMTHRELKSIMNEADLDRDGRLDYKEFSKNIKKSNFNSKFSVF